MVMSCIIPQCQVWYGKLKEEFNVEFHNFTNILAKSRNFKRQNIDLSNCLLSGSS